MEIDTTKPHIGRIYDFVLGGHHNYEVDRQAAERMMQVFPLYPQWARLNRWFLQFVGGQWLQSGHERVLDLASGMPTQGHFNDWLPEARILFSDYDELSVSYGQEIVAALPNMKYVHADLRNPEGLMAAATEFFGSDRRLAVGAIGILYLLPDDVVRSLMKALHAFCSEGSVMAISFANVPDLPNAQETYKKLSEVAAAGRITLTMRSAEQMAEVVAPWRMREVRDVERWLYVDNMIPQEERERVPLELLGAMLEH